MNAEIKNTLGRIDAQVDYIGNTYAKALADTRRRGIATLKSLGWLKYGMQQSVDDLKEINHD